MSKVNHKNLVSLALTGDEDARNELAASIRATAYKLGCAFHRSAQALGADGRCFADDLANDVTLKILRRPLHELTEIENLDGWVCRIASNDAINAIRSLRRQRIDLMVPRSALGEGEYDALGAQLEQIAAPTEDLILNFDLERELAAFAARGPQQKKRLGALLSHTLGGDSQREIASAHHVRRETVVGWIKSAKQHLRQALIASGVIGPGGRARRRRRVAASAPAAAAARRRGAASRRAAA